MSDWQSMSLGDITFQSKERKGELSHVERVYGVDRHQGLTPAAKYQSKDLRKYKLLKPGMFVYNPMRLNIGSIAFCDDEHGAGLVSPDYVVFGCDESEVEPLFLKYLIEGQEWKRWTAAAGVGSVRVRIYYEELARMPITIPKLREQRSIVRVLEVLDRKIDLNNRMVSILESIVCAFFRSWFVDFDPVNAKMEGREPVGLSYDIAEHFPDSLDCKNEDSCIPTGWSRESLDSIADFLNGLALQKHPATGYNDLPVIKIAQLRKGNTVDAPLAGPTVPERYIIQNGDFLFSWSGSLEAKLWCGGRGALNQHLFKVTSDEYPQWFYAHWVLEHLSDFRSIAADKATTMGHIKRQHLTEAKCAVPPRSLIDAVSSFMGPLHDQQIEYAREAATLKRVRDALLPKLLSGEIHFNDVQASAAEEN